MLGRNPAREWCKADTSTGRTGTSSVKLPAPVSGQRGEQNQIVCLGCGPSHVSAVQYFSCHQDRLPKTMAKNAGAIASPRAIRYQSQERCATKRGCLRPPCPSSQPERKSPSWFRSLNEGQKQGARKKNDFCRVRTGDLLRKP